ncbi:helix-turn-helix domain-containing protein [Ruegeria atlantica]|uniref:helix-turn-helix domain-containing protein n=1 Tax=Ruegeria atlantica TaxID=81569 RepID=UPI00147D171C|nr:helix-turn-helix domain-containing protein [Ruegeria atlantica]
MTGINHRPAEITPAEARAAVVALEAHGGNVSATARALEITRAKLQRRLRKADMWGISAHGEVLATPARRLEGKAGQVRRYLLTCAQSNTGIHPEFWRNLAALSDHYRAQIMVARVRYNHSESQVAQEKTNRAADNDLWYAPEVEPYLADERVEICPGLTWAGDMNIIPTAVNPLSGLDSFTGAASCVFPHPQIAMKSVATAPGTDAKFNFTTGAVTLKNYIKRKAGLKAEFHHAFGALLVEVDPSGFWFARQINATDEGEIYDLDVRVDGGEVTTGNRVEVFTPGDIHGTKADPEVLAAVWGKDGLVDTLRPRHQVLHDVLNFGSRSHHNTFFDLVAAHYDQADTVEGEVRDTAAILNGLVRPWMETVVAKANHDEHLEKWIETADFRRDPINAGFYLTAAAAKVAAIKAKDAAFDLVAWVLRNAGLDPSIRFLSRFEKLKIAGIRHDQHGDLGPNGSRGNATNIARTGEKANIGHSHSAAIFHGCYQAGTFSLLEMGYNRGPSSWSHSAILTYGNGKRAIVTLRAGKWRA